METCLEFALMVFFLFSFVVVAVVVFVFVVVAFYGDESLLLD